MAPDTPFRDAEDWLAARGVAREPLDTGGPAPATDADAGAGRTPVSVREATRIASETPVVADVDAEAGSRPDGRADLQDEVAAAVAYARRSTATAPRSEAQLRGRFERKGYTGVVADLAMQRCRSERIVDDAALAAALVAEGRGRGHGPSRLRLDLARRRLDGDVVDAALAEVEAEDPQAAAFALARQRARGLGAVAPEAAYRRLVAYVARRGYPDALARKVARDALWTDREDQRVAEQ